MDKNTAGKSSTDDKKEGRSDLTDENNSSLDDYGDAGKPISLVQVIAKANQNTRLVTSLSVVGILLFLAVAVIVPFRDQLFNRLYPKQQSRASACTGGSLIPSERAGFVYTGGDLSQSIKSLGTPLYYTYDTTIGPNKQVYLLGGYTHNNTDPLGLRLLMDNNLSNVDFKGLWGQSPNSWNILTSGRSGDAVVETAEENTVGGGTSVKISNQKSPSGTQIAQAFKKGVREGQSVVFGAWVKAADANSVKVLLQNTQAPYQEFGTLVSKIEPNNWTFVTGFGQIPAGVSNFQLVLRVSGQNQTAWFSGPVAAVMDLEQQNQSLTDLVLSRCGSAWFVDDEPGWEQTYTKHQMKPLSADIYALIYGQYYALIKSIDPSAQVMPGGLAGAPTAFDEKSAAYSPKLFLDNFRVAYKKYFNTEPQLDALNMHYLASDATSWGSAKDLEAYMTKVRAYMDQVPDWKGKPIWIGKLGVDAQAPNNGVDFAQAAVNFLKDNRLNIVKWFWFDTCGFNTHLATLFSSKNKVCSWPMKLSPLGQMFSEQNISQPATTSATPALTTPTVAPKATPTPGSATPTPTELVPTSTPVPPTATPTPPAVTDNSGSSSATTP